jgi:predicted Rossmann fold nucleotide-binding protein DprA/Smf involved in DNA uptake
MPSAPQTDWQEESYWLALLCDGLLPRAQAKRLLYRWCVEQARSLKDLFELGPSDLLQAAEVSAEVAQRLTQAEARGASWAALLKDLAAQGIHLLTRADVAYPESLAQCFAEEQLPYFLMYWGALDALSQPAVAISGHGHPSAEAAQMARTLSEAAASEGFALVGGYERGIERIACDAARQTPQAAAISVLPMGLRAFAAASKGLCEPRPVEQALLLSPYEPDAPPSAAQAAARCTIVAGLAEALLIVAPERRPGDWPLADALLAAQRPVYVWQEPEEDASLVETWIAAGARPFADAAAAQQLLSESLGAQPDIAADNDTAEEDTTLSTFPNADAAMDALRKGGRVPATLARRLRETLGE